jgi:hypothetical protein
MANREKKLTCPRTILNLVSHNVMHVRSVGTIGDQWFYSFVKNGYNFTKVSLKAVIGTDINFHFYNSLKLATPSLAPNSQKVNNYIYSKHMDNFEVNNSFFDNNDALKFILRNQLARITMYLTVSVLGFCLIYYFLVAFDIREDAGMLIAIIAYIAAFRIENLRVLTVFRTLNILRLVDSKEIKWNLTEDQLTFGKGRSSTGYDSFPIKALNCYYDNKIVTIKPITDYQTINMEPLEV